MSCYDPETTMYDDNLTEISKEHRSTLTAKQADMQPVEIRPLNPQEARSIAFDDESLDALDLEQSELKHSLQIHAPLGILSDPEQISTANTAKGGLAKRKARTHKVRKPRSLTKAGKAHARAVRSYPGGACQSCKKKKTKCTHRLKEDEVIWSSDYGSTPEQSPERSKVGIVKDIEAHVECERRHPTAAILNGDERMAAFFSYTAIEDTVAVIRSRVLAALPSREANQHYALLKVQWDILAFMEEQFDDHEHSDILLGSVITITGSAEQAQATTCSEYAKQIWAACGSKIVTSLQDALNSSEHESYLSIGTKTLDQGISVDSELCSKAQLEFNIVPGCVRLRIGLATSDLLVDIVQQLAWMGSALRTSTNGRAQYCKPQLQVFHNSKEDGHVVFNIAFGLNSLGEKEQSCWLPLFANPVIAQGFPVPNRENKEQGLEVPLEIMAALGGARHVTEFEGGLVLKGYSAMFVPVKRHHQSIQWHLIRGSDEQRIRYRDVSSECPSRAMLEEVDQKYLANTRTFLGWWKSAETHLGTADAAYDSIDWSPIGKVKRAVRMSGFNLGFQNVLTGQLSFIMGAKDGSLHFSQKRPFQRILQCAEKTAVVLYDTADRRAWLVPALDVILHVIQTRHHLSAYQIDGKLVELTSANPRNGRAAAGVAIAANRLRQLYERDFATEKSYYFKDAVLDIWSQMERMMEKGDSIETRAGLALHGTMQCKLHGWEYMSLVDEKNFQRKEQKIAKSSGGWVDLVNDVDCLVLFATGLGEIIRPVSDLGNLCLPWRTLPKGKDFLAAGVPIMELLYSEAGSRFYHKYLSTSHLQWNRGSSLFERCSEISPSGCQCDRTQQIYHDSIFKTFGHVRPPGRLETDGCVVFGQACHSFRAHNSIGIRQNAVHTPNTPLQNRGIIKYNAAKDERLPSPPPAASLSPDFNKVNAHAMKSPETPPSPLNLTEDIVHHNTLALNRRRKLSHIQLSESDNSNDETSFSEDSGICPAEHLSKFKNDRKFKRPRVGSKQILCASEDGNDSAHVGRHIPRKRDIGRCSHPRGCSCT